MAAAAVSLLVVRSRSLAAENERLKVELLERERALSRVQLSVTTLQHRLSLLAATAEPRPLAQLDAVNQVLRKIAREVLLLCLLGHHNML